MKRLTLPPASERNMSTSPQQLTEVPCNLCGSSDVEVLSLRDRSGRYLRTVICRQCGLVYSSPRPTSEQTRAFYSRQYRIEYKGVSKPKKKHIYRAGRVALARYGQIRDILKPNAVVLDVGSGGGEFVYLLRHLGFDARGIEPNEGYACYSIEEYHVPIQMGFAQDAEFPEREFDVITMHHVLEHTDNPYGIICKLRDWLKDSGFLVVEVPDLETVSQTPSRRFHVAHLYNFNQAALNTLGRKAGYGVFRTKTPSDEGNLWTIFQKSARAQAVSGQIAGNAEKILRIIRQHTITIHYLSRHPYARLFRKIAQSIHEQLETRSSRTGKDILDQLFRESL